MLYSTSSIRRRLSANALCGTLGLLTCSLASAWEQLPEGLEVGKWILAPSFTASYEAEDNVFLKTDDTATSDRVATLGGELKASLPFRNSNLELGYAATKEDYAKNDFQRDLTQLASVELQLEFRTGDRLTLRDRYRRDFARAEETDPGGETTFQGEPYNFNTWQVDLTRDDPRRRGYRLHVERQDFIYEGKTDIGFFEYRGFANYFEYYQPLPDDRSWVVHYGTRRFDHYDPESAVGVPFRTEKSDNVSLGMRGLLGKDQPYRIGLGYGRFRYEGDDGSEFHGLVGTAAWRLWLGGRTKLDLEAIRRPLPSNLSTYYINSAAVATLEREWQRFDLGTEFEYTKNAYADEIPDLECDGRRKDSTYAVEAFWKLKIHERISYDLSSFYSRRSSTCDTSEYDAAGIETGLRIGWF